MSGPALTFRGVKKRLGRTQALDGMDLTVPRGSIFGLIGPNGAGKTTSFSIACGFLRADAGEVRILDEPGFDWRRHKGRVGAMPQDAMLAGALSCRDHLEHLARLGGLDAAAVRREVERTLAAVALSDRAGDRADTLSHGMRRRLGVAQALLGDPELVILDEPTSGLDPRHAFELREVLRGLRGRGAIVISSHNLGELEALCDDVAFIEKGRSTGAGSMAQITGRGERVEIRLAEGPVPEAAVRAALPADRVAWDAAARLLTVDMTAEKGAAPRAIEDVIGVALRALLDGKARIAEVKRGASLEQRYLEGSVAHAGSGEGDPGA